MLLLKLWIYENPGKTLLTILILILIANKCKNQEIEKRAEVNQLRETWIKTDKKITSNRSSSKSPRLSIYLQGKDTVYVFEEYLKFGKKWREIDYFMDREKAIRNLEECRGCIR